MKSETISFNNIMTKDQQIKEVLIQRTKALRYWDYGWSVKQIANLLSCNERTVRSRLESGKKAELLLSPYPRRSWAPWRCPECGHESRNHLNED